MVSILAAQTLEEQRLGTTSVPEIIGGDNQQLSPPFFCKEVRMPQWRKLHLKALDSLDIAEMPDDFTRLMWLLLPLIADREGRAIDNYLWIRAKLFPLRAEIGPEQIEQAMTYYAERDMIRRYIVKDRNYFKIVNFAQYQGKTDREAASVIPDQVKQARRSRSGPTPELVLTKFRLNTDVDSDSDVDSEERGSEAPPAPAPPKKTDKTLTPQQAMVTALADVMGMKPSLNAKRLVSLAAELLKDGISPDEVRRIYGRGGWWYANDWRGKKGDFPNQAAVRETIARAQADGKPAELVLPADLDAEARAVHEEYIQMNKHLHPEGWDPR